MEDYYKGNPEFYRFFYAGEQDAEAEAFLAMTGWKRFWGSDLEGLNGDTWVVYRDVSDLPVWLQEYARFMEGFKDNPATYSFPELDLDGTADALFTQAKSGYIEDAAALARLQEILSGPAEKKYDKAFYVGLLREIAEDKGEKPYVFGQLKRDMLDNVSSEEVELQSNLLLHVYREQDSVVVELSDLTSFHDGTTVIPLFKFLGMTSGEFEQTLSEVCCYNMVPDEYSLDDVSQEEIEVEDSWEEMASKSVSDSDGFMTDYTLYYNPKFDTYICMFGDKDFYEPSVSGADAVFETEAEAWEWYNNYQGFELDEVEADSGIDSQLKERVILAMEAAGYHYNDLESHDGYQNFNGDYGVSMTFNNFSEVVEWLEGVVFDDPAVNSSVESILAPERSGRLREVIEDAETRAGGGVVEGKPQEYVIG